MTLLGEPRTRCRPPLRKAPIRRCWTPWCCVERSRISVGKGWRSSRDLSGALRWYENTRRRKVKAVSFVTTLQVSRSESVLRPAGMISDRFVGGAAACGDAVGPDDREVDLPALHQMAAGVVDDHRIGHAVLAEFERGQRRALVARPRLVDEHAQRNAAVVRHVDRRRRRAPIDGGEPTGVAMGEDVDPPTKLAMERLDQRQTGFADATI